MVGKFFIINNDYKVEVISYKNNKEVTIKFENGFTKVVEKGVLLKGKIKNPYHPTLYNIGYIGIGKYKSYDNSKKLTKSYVVWADMIKRGYDENYKQKYPTYKDVAVCEEWHNFQNFAEWFEENYNPEYMEGWCLDKDIICTECKIYSPENCCFVPQEINKLLLFKRNNKGLYPTGVNFNKQNRKFASKIKKYNKTFYLGYFLTPEEAFEKYKEAKEQHIKEVADKWRDLIGDKIYKILITYKIT